MGDFNIDLLKCETSQISHDFLMSSQSCYLIPTVDKPTRVHRNSATLIDNIFFFLSFFAVKWTVQKPFTRRLHKLLIKVLETKKVYVDMNTIPNSYLNSLFS